VLFVAFTYVESRRLAAMNSPLAERRVPSRGQANTSPAVVD